MIEYLLKNGADPKYRVRRGGWNKSGTYPIFRQLAYLVHKLSNEKAKIKFIEVLAENGVCLNHENIIFKLMDLGGLASRIDELREKYQTVNFY